MVVEVGPNEQGMEDLEGWMEVPDFKSGQIETADDPANFSDDFIARNPSPEGKHFLVAKKEGGEWQFKWASQVPELSFTIDTHEAKPNADSAK